MCTPVGGQSYKDAIASLFYADLWEICWYSRSPLFADVYSYLLYAVSARLAVQGNLIGSVHAFDSLSDATKRSLEVKARKEVRRKGMYIVDQGAPVAAREFESGLGFSPGRQASKSEIENIIINRSVLVMCWPAHRIAGCINNIPFVPTISLSISNPSWITKYLREHQSVPVSADWARRLVMLRSAKRQLRGRYSSICRRGRRGQVNGGGSRPSGGLRIKQV